MEKNLRSYTEAHEYRTITDDYNALEGDEALYETVVGDKKYKVQTDENGNPVKLSRYSEQYKLRVEISFNSGIDNEASEKVCELLKSLYIQRISDLKPV